MPKTLILTLSFAYRQYGVRIARKIIFSYYVITYSVLDTPRRELCARIDVASKHDHMKTKRIAYIKIKRVV